MFFKSASRPLWWQRGRAANPLALPVCPRLPLWHGDSCVTTTSTTPAGPQVGFTQKQLDDFFESECSMAANDKLQVRVRVRGLASA
jgi:hypothetical protein